MASVSAVTCVSAMTYVSAVTYVLAVASVSVVACDDDAEVICSVISVTMDATLPALLTRKHQIYNIRLPVNKSRVILITASVSSKVLQTSSYYFNNVTLHLLL